MKGLCERPRRALLGTTAARALMLRKKRPLAPPAFAIAASTPLRDPASTARLITRDDPLCCAACARTSGPSLSGCGVAADGARPPNDNSAARTPNNEVREATCDAPLRPVFCRQAFRTRDPGGSY